MHELFALKQNTNNDFATLRGYYATFTDANSSLYDVAQFMATRCNVMDKKWQPAIDWYENRIANPPSYPDSVFAVIDLGDIHLRMEADTTGLQSKSRPVTFIRFPNIKPKSKADYEQNRSALLATLPQKSGLQTEQPVLYGANHKGILYQNIPNPATKSTTIVYELFEKGSVEVRIYNSLGQLIQTALPGVQDQGMYEIEISLERIPSGLYQYALYIDNIKVDSRKLVVTK
jgi:hypothetical protein